jgi:predicted nucleic acid-binding Zn ribbon protein
MLLTADGTTLSNVLDGTQRAVELEEKVLEARKERLERNTMLLYYRWAILLAAVVILVDHKTL